MLIIYMRGLSQYLPYENLKINNDVSLEDVLKTADDSDVGYC